MTKDAQVFMNSRRMRHIKRCNNFPCVMPEDVAQHSYFVAMLCKVFVEEYNNFCNVVKKENLQVNLGEVLSKALCHDWDEAFTSDIPYVVKHLNPEVHKSLEKGLREHLSSILDTCTCSIHNLYDCCKTCKDGTSGVIVGICDMLELAIYCYEECMLNNTALEPILQNCIYYLDNMLSSLANTLELNCGTISSVSPTINELYLMIKEYNFSSSCWCIDIEEHK